MNISFDFNFWTLLFCLMNFLLTLFVVVSNRSKAAAEELKGIKAELTKDIRQHSERLSRIESDIENSINDEDIKAVHRRVDEISAMINKFGGQLEIVVSNLGEIHKVLIHRGNGG